MQLVHQSRPVVPRDRLLRLSEVETIIGCKKSSIYRMMNEGKFPKGISYSERLVVWPETIVLQWVQDVINQSTATSQGAV